MALKLLMILCQLGLVVADNNTTTAMTTSTEMSTTEEMTTSMVSTTDGARVVISGCTELSGDIATLVGNADASSAFASALASVLSGVDAEHIQNVVFETGKTCGGRRLDERRLQSTGTVRYDIVLPASAAGTADSIVTAFQSVRLASLQSALETALTAAGITASITVSSAGALMITESGGTTATTSTGAEDTPSAAYHNSFAFGVLMALVAYMM